MVAKLRGVLKLPMPRAFPKSDESRKVPTDRSPQNFRAHPAIGLPNRCLSAPEPERCSGSSTSTRDGAACAWLTRDGRYAPSQSFSRSRAQRRTARSVEPKRRCRRGPRAATPVKSAFSRGALTEPAQERPPPDPQAAGHRYRFSSFQATTAARNSGKYSSKSSIKTGSCAPTMASSSGARCVSRRRSRM